MSPRVALALLALLGGCAGPGAESAPAPLPACAPAALSQAPDAHVAAPPVAELVKHFDKATARELSVATEPSITPAQIDAIRDEDARARRALTRLGKMRAHPPAAVLDAARAAVRQLEQTLDDIVTSTSD